MSIESITQEYKMKNELDELSNYDNKLIKSIFNLRNNYADELKKRKCSVFLKDHIVTSVFDKQNKEKNDKKEKQNKEVADCTTICEAVQMNGKNCKSKAKPGEKFCGRHCKK